MMPQAPYPGPSRSEAPLWAAALVASLILNTLLLVALGSEAARKWFVASEMPITAAPPPAERVLQMIFTPPETEPAAEENRKRFARTTEDQRAEPADPTDFIGERDTRATSDRAADATAPPLPSQAGIEPRDEFDVETTESDFRDGPLEVPDAPDSTPEPVTQPRGAEVDTPGEAETLEVAETPPPPPPADRLLESPFPTEVPVPAAEPEVEKVAENPPGPPPAEAPPQGVAEAPPETPAIVDPTRNPPGFKGQQRKTAIRGSISRTGRSSLDVEDTALGRYQAQLSRAVELEWQRNCVRHRDFITPGFLTVRFFVQTDGRVRSVEFVGEMETGEVQKGFTLNSIRNAAIPAMPEALRRELDGEPLELIFNFYF
jgi:hypothetical protein